MPIAISRALEVISEDGRESDKRHTWEEYLAAIQLGREALKKVKAVREGKEWVGINLLPGEIAE